MQHQLHQPREETAQPVIVEGHDVNSDELRQRQ
jgi:hypothetical protein